MKKILFLNGLSRYAPATYEYALNIAAHFKASLTMLHVIETRSPASRQIGTTHDPFWEDQREIFLEEEAQSTRMKLQHFITEHSIPGFEPVQQDIKVKGGALLPATMEAIRAARPDLLIMGLHRHNRFLLANRQAFSDLLLTLRCPVLLVPAKAAFSGLLTFLYVTDRVAEADLPVFHYLQNWATAFHLQVHVLCIHPREPESGNEELIRAQLQKALGKNSTPIVWTEPQGGEWIYEERKGGDILELAEEIRADLIVMRARRQGFWSSLLRPSLEKQIAQHSAIPMLIGEWNEPRELQMLKIDI